MHARILARTLSRPPDPPLPSSRGAYLGWHAVMATTISTTLIQPRMRPSHAALIPFSTGCFVACPLMSPAFLTPQRRGPRSLGFLQRLRGLLLVGETGFEPATPWSRTKCSTRLSHSPMRGSDRRRIYP